MKNPSKLLLKFVFVTLSIFSTGCSMFSSSEVTPETKMAVLRVCDEYLRNLANGQSNQAEAMIAWSDYGPVVNDGLSRMQFTDIVRAKKGIWSKDENPLLGLDVIDVDISGDKATVALIKKSKNLKIKIKLIWIGRGWLIVDDNVLSEGGVFRT